MRKNMLILQGVAFSMLILLPACSNLPSFLPIQVMGVTAPVISLNGDWKFSMDPPEAFWENGTDFSQWPDIKVPGECQMQGFAIRHDRPYVYKRTFTIPADYAGKQIYLVFHGVYSYARVWVNGAFIREHYGGFTKWDCDISSHAIPGEKNTLTLEIVDRIDEISYASGYAKHQIGGILRDVELIALPGLNFRKFYVETELDGDYQDAELKIFYELSHSSDAEISVALGDAGQKPMVKMVLKDAPQTGQISLDMEDPLKWDAEHPYLYTLVTTLSDGDETVLSRTDKVGFREVQVDGNRLLVNGRPVKLRGADRHDIHPLLGRMTTPELDREDVLLAREANMNFIRTSHYPPSETFLRYCDEYGLYVEDESAVCFVHTHRSQNYQETGTSQDDPAFTHRYLSQLEEMVDNHRNHPSVIIWSIGNENHYGSNFLKSYQWIKETDRTRPVIYSYPGQVPDSLRIYDILSIHYPSWSGDIEQYGFSIEGFEYSPMPVLFDEWAHVACYNKPTLLADPNVRNFWGQSLDSMWTNLFEADGGLGGAIWCMIDETFMLPENLEGFRDWWGWTEGVLDFEGHAVGYGEWGIIDTWRRKKPEYWGTKKAYSPARIGVKNIRDVAPGKEIRIPVHNRFDHTNFNELKITWSYNGRSGKLNEINLEPHQKGEMVIPAMDWQDRTSINIAFYLGNGMLVDEYNLGIGKREPVVPVLQSGPLEVEDEADRIIIRGEEFSLSVDKTEGIIMDLEAGGVGLIRSGPHLNLKTPGKRFYGSVESIIDLARNWKCRSVRHEIKDGIATVYSSGSYGKIDVSFVFRVDGHGTMQVDYEWQGPPYGNLVQEAGIYFVAGDSFREVSWDRQGYFTAYPEADLGLPKGKADLTYRPPMSYRQKPGHEWIHDTEGFYYFGPDSQLVYSNMARSLKENIYSFSLSTGDGKSISVHGGGTQACRFDRIDGNNHLIINNLWDYPDLLWGNYMKMISLPGHYKGSATLSLQTKQQ
jgi:beta-galactosidase